MANRQTQIQIPERTADEPPASADQLQAIRQLTAGLSLQGYRFDYRKLGQQQANAILNQLQAMNDQHPPAPSKPRKQGPGCVASLAKGTTALVVWAIVLACVAGAGYLIYNHIQKNPNPFATSTNPDDSEELASNTPDPADRPDNPGSTGSTGSTIFEGLGVSDSPSSPTNRTTNPGSTDTPGTDPQNPATTPDAATLPPELRELGKQLRSLEELLVTLSQGTRQTFELDVRTQSSEAMQRALDKLPQALTALDSADPTMSARVRAAVDAFAADQVDGPALRDDIKAIRRAIEALK